MPISAYLRDLRARVGSELLLVPAVAAIIRDAQGRVLYQRRSDNGDWSLPVGAIDRGETPSQALVREVWEETGLRVVPERLVGAFGGEEFRVTYPNGDQVEYTALLFACRVVGGTLDPRDDETAELRFFAAEEMPALSLPYPRDILASKGTPAEVVFQPAVDWVEAFGGKLTDVFGTHEENLAWIEAERRSWSE